MSYKRMYYQPFVGTTETIAEKAVVSSKIDDEAVTTPKIAPDAVTSDKIKDETIKSEDIKAGTIQTSDLGNGIITTEKLADGSVTPSKLTTEVLTRPITPGVGSSEIEDYAVTQSKLADNSVATAKLKDGGTTAAKLAGDAVETDKIKDGAVTTPKIASEAVDASKIKAGSVGYGELAAYAVGAAKLGTSAVETPKIKDGAVTPAKLSFTPATRPLVPPIVTTEITDGNVTKDKLAPASVSPEKVEAVDVPADGEIPTCKVVDSVKTFEWKPAPVGITKHTELTDKEVAGVIDHADESVTTAKIKDANVTPAKASVGFGRFVPRPCATYDFQTSNFQCDGTLHVNGLDLSAIVPENAIAVTLSILSTPMGPDAWGVFEPNQTTMIFNKLEFVPPNSANRGMIELDTVANDRKIDYTISPDVETLYISVTGWFI